MGPRVPLVRIQNGRRRRRGTSRFGALRSGRRADATRLVRHIQRCEAEKHLAAAALAAAGLDVLLTDASHVLLGDVTVTVLLMQRETRRSHEVPALLKETERAFGIGSIDDPKW